MSSDRRPIFWFLWPRPDPRAPVDERAVQTRLVRVTPRGPARLLALALASVATVGLLASAIIAVTESGLTLGSLVGAAVAASALALTLRGWVAGTYVNDHGVVVETTWRRLTLPWTSIEQVVTDSSSSPVLGLPVRMDSMRVCLLREDGSVVATHIYRTSPDLCWRPEAFDMARLRLENWQAQR